MSDVQMVQIGNATLYCGDCREILSALPPIDAVLTDPPYGIGFSHGGNENSGIGAGKYATKFAGKKIHADNAPFDPTFILDLKVPTVLWGGNHFCSRLPDSSSWLVWDKRAASGHQNDFADCEIAWTNLGTVARMFRHHWDGMMRASERGERFHPTQKPVALMSWVITLLPETTNTILDPYMGSGPVGIAALEAGKQYIGIEIDPHYFSIACERIDNAQRQGRLIA